jgi:7-cyano-7-deazaguanine reductase
MKGDRYLDTLAIEPMSQITPSPSQMEVFPNQYPQRDYLVTIRCPEFTAVCPKTGQPDFGTLTFSYVPDQVIIELKSLKLYLQAYRNVGIFYEVLDDFIKAVQPRKLTLVGEFTPRGGISSVLTVEYSKK